MRMTPLNSEPRLNHTWKESGLNPPQSADWPLHRHIPATVRPFSLFSEPFYSVCQTATRWLETTGKAGSPQLFHFILVTVASFTLLTFSSGSLSHIYDVVTLIPAGVVRLPRPLRHSTVASGDARVRRLYRSVPSWTGLPYGHVPQRRGRVSEMNDPQIRCFRKPQITIALLVGRVWGPPSVIRSASFLTVVSTTPSYWSNY